MNTSNRTICRQARVPDSLAGCRLDQVAARLFPDYSRARLQTWIKAGCLLLDGQQPRPRQKAVPGAMLTLQAELQAAPNSVAQALPLNVLYEDEQLLIINKAAGVVVHPAAGHRQGTLLNGLLHHCPDLAQLPRAGIVHRLDKDTTGVLVVARTLAAHSHLVRQLQQRNIQREYQAVVQGVVTGGGTIAAPLGRHPRQRKKRAVVAHGQPASTHFRVIRCYRAHSHIRVQLETGRTHQIRVHMAYRRYPLVGDPIYGGRLQLPAAAASPLRRQLQGFRRQALHASRLSLCLPGVDEPITVEAPLPDDFCSLLQALAADAADHGRAPAAVD